jgi:hypothetical protein
MIDVENKVFDRVYNKVVSQYPKIFATSEYVREVANFPAYSLIEMDNRVNMPSRSLSKIENMADLMYELNVYSNKKSGKKQECKKIWKLIDSEMSDMGFTRTYGRPIDNLEDATIYRIVAIYEKIENGEL